jgi:hypothetical protein
MDFIQDHGDAGLRISAFLMDPDGAAALPEFTRAKLLESAGAPSPVDRYVQTAEVLFGAAGEINAKGRMLGAQLGSFIAANGWHGGARYRAIGFAFMRRSSIVPPPGVTYQAAEDDPEPLQGMVPPVENPAP